jgi:short-subunit dehydrogenase
VKTKSLKSSTVVITGASSGIGKAAALLFAKEGANLVLAARSETILQELASQCQAIGGDAIAVKTDVSDKESVLDLAQVAIDFYGRIDVWINNAGVGAIGEFQETPLKAHEQVIKTNLLGPLYGSYAVLPYFIRQRAGVIINTNSTGGHVGNPYTVAYSASKFGLRGLSEALRFELKKFPHIEVCDIFAGLVDGPAHSHAANYIGKEIRPAKPLVNPEKMAAAMVRLAKNPKPSIHLGVQDRLGRFGHSILPGLTGWIMNKVLRNYFKRAKAIAPSNGNLFAPDYSKTTIHGGYLN